jgi:hypothetical protein
MGAGVTPAAAAACPHNMKNDPIDPADSASRANGRPLPIVWRHESLEKSFDLTSPVKTWVLSTPC